MITIYGFINFHRIVSKVVVLGRFLTFLAIYSRLPFIGEVQWNWKSDILEVVNLFRFGFRS